MLSLLSSILVVLIALCDAKRTFFNEGTVKGWDRLQRDANGTIDEVTNEAAFNGTTCLKFSQTYNRQYHGRYTNMVHVLDAARLGRTGYYGFAFKLDKNWQFDPNWVTLMKFMADFGDVDCGHHRRGWNPTTMVWVRNDNLYTRYRFGHPCNNMHQKVEHVTTKEFKLGKVIPGVWHTIVLGIHWHRDKKGWFRVWYDENGPPNTFQLVVDDIDVHTLPELNDDRPFDFRLGIDPFWYDVHTKMIHENGFIPDGGQTEKIVYFDKIGMGPEFENGDPNQSHDCAWCSRGDGKDAPPGIPELPPQEQPGVVTAPGVARAPPSAPA